MLTPSLQGLHASPASVNTRAGTNVRITASQPLIENPTSRLTGCSGVEIDLPIAAIARPTSWSPSRDPGDGVQAIGIGSDERIAPPHGLDDPQQPDQHGVGENDGDNARARRCHAVPRSSAEFPNASVMPSAVKVHWLATMVAVSSARIAAPDSQLRTMRMRTARYRQSARRRIWCETSALPLHRLRNID